MGSQKPEGNNGKMHYVMTGGLPFREPFYEPKYVPGMTPDEIVVGISTAYERFESQFAALHINPKVYASFSQITPEGTVRANGRGYKFDKSVPTDEAGRKILFSQLPGFGPDAEVLENEAKEQLAEAALHNLLFLHRQNAIYLRGFHFALPANGKRRR